jgi:hypothetical protein
VLAGLESRMQIRKGRVLPLSWVAGNLALVRRTRKSRACGKGGVILQKIVPLTLNTKTKKN